MKLIKIFIKIINLLSKKECPGGCGKLIKRSHEMCTACMLGVMADVMMSAQNPSASDHPWEIVPAQDNPLQLELGFDTSGNIMISQRGSGKWKRLSSG